MLTLAMAAWARSTTAKGQTMAASRIFEYRKPSRLESTGIPLVETGRPRPCWPKSGLRGCGPSVSRPYPANRVSSPGHVICRVAGWHTELKELLDWTLRSGPMNGRHQRWLNRLFQCVPGQLVLGQASRRIMRMNAMRQISVPAPQDAVAYVGSRHSREGRSKGQARTPQFPSAGTPLPSPRAASSRPDADRRQRPAAPGRPGRPASGAPAVRVSPQR